MILFVVLVLCAPTQGSELPITVVNPSFELPGSGTLITNWSQIDGWSGSSGSGTGVEKNEYYSPVDGEWYAFHAGGESYIYQETNHTIATGETCTLKVWARSINSVGNTATTTAEARFYYGSTEITSITADVNPVRLLGDPRNYSNDDGGNVWIDQGYRMEFADGIFYQLVTDDPLLDPWTYYNDSDYDFDMAVSPIITPQGLKALNATYYEDYPPFYSEIWLKPASGSPPDYTWGNLTVVLSHEGSEDPWVIDSHLYYDDSTGKLWMAWGGGTFWVCEMDPTDGMLINHPSNKEFDAHPEYHTAVAYWNGDEWSSEWFEGPALYKHNGYWYLFGSYGHLAQNYTIRMGRGTGPTGPFYDKDGVGLTEWDSSESEYGNTLILGADGGQANPGHPHIWEENGKFYMGYDYTDEYTGSGTDRLGIRRLYWVDDWPVVAYTPIEVTFNADDYPAAIGQKLGISLRNVGSSSSDAAFDYVSLTYTTSAPPTPDIDGNGDVNFVDYSLFAAQWMRTECNDCNGADFTTDGNVDYNDLDIFADNWLRDYNLVGYWKLDGDANDSSGYGNDGTVHGGAVWLPTEGKVDGALLFDGLNDCIVIPDDGHFDITDELTITAWIKKTPGNDGYVLMRNAADDSYRYYGIYTRGAADEVRFYYETSGGLANEIWSSITIDDDLWHHLALVVNYPTAQLYVDGLPQSEETMGGNMLGGTADVKIGRRDPDNVYFVGLIDEVRIYDITLGQQAIQKLADI